MMNTNRLDVAAARSDDDLLTSLERHAAGCRDWTADLIAEIAELTRRKNSRGEGEGTVFKHCTQVLKLSEAATFNRMAAAGAARKFPLILDLLADGSINLTTVRVLAGVLTMENHQALLHEAAGKSKEEVSRIKVRFDPKPDVPTSVRKVPMPQAAPTAGLVFGEAESGQSPTSTAAPPAGPSAPSKPAVEPLAPNRYKVQFTVDDETRDRLRRVQDLMRREIPSGDAGMIFARALILLEQQAEKKAFSATARPRRPRGTKPRSRNIPADVQRTVWTRDDGRCAFVGRTGMRCSERSFLDFHHRDPHANDGPATVENISLRCRNHNAYEAELVFGRFDHLADREWLPMAP